MARRYDEAIEQLRKTVELEPRYAHAHCWLGKAYLQKGMLQQGLSELQEAASLPGGDSPLFAPWLGYAYALSEKRADAFEVINRMKAQQQKVLVPLSGSRPSTAGSVIGTKRWVAGKGLPGTRPAVLRSGNRATSRSVTF